ncbi:hypothetical protein SO694_00096038 [Aureococcus anophagefferens]|uniref:Uncharacterized protein n=1 Tax=Aureococcus anophagefferens TaxID=44056 RepID=A0ABR1FS88_AURAN
MAPNSSAPAPLKPRGGGTGGGEQHVLVPQLALIKDPRKQPRLVCHPDRKEPDSRVGEKRVGPGPPRARSAARSARASRYKVIGKNGATVRKGESLESEIVDKVAIDDTVLVEEENADKTRVRIDDPEGWISTKVLLPHSVKQVKEGWKGDIQEYDPGWEELGYGLKKEDFEDPTNLTLDTMKEDLRTKLEAEGVDFS